ncbi:MAG: hypothetical protein H0V17_10480 [Deltaproteobacteria bacterium]|nr:hypothetical protein [Deltaproteobacteria bacterium]
MRVLAVAVFLIACGSKPPPPQKKLCDAPEPGQAMTEAQCQCRDGRIVLSVPRAVELHCEADEHELGTAKLGDRDGWCCK